MKTVTKLLNKELKEWKKQYASDKRNFKGQEKEIYARNCFKECKKHIAELEKAIKILNLNSPCRKAQRIQP